MGGEPGIGDGRTRLKILIVDDSAAMRDRLDDIFSRFEGIQIVGHAQDAPEAFDRIARCGPTQSYWIFTIPISKVLIAHDWNGKTDEALGRPIRPLS